jgi:hypothetical protein
MCNAIKFLTKEVTGMSSSKREEEVMEDSGGGRGMYLWLG